MIILLSGALVIEGLAVWGFMTSRKQRGIDRRNFAAFVGFSAAVIAVAATTLELIVADLQQHPMDPVLGGLGFVLGVIAMSL
jgi:NO-binding membrane sensor protein with MHYT domain